jgi:hypothetical protein
MRGIGIALAAALLFSGAGAAEYWVEADLNGVFGDPQPDSIVASVGQDVPVDVWAVGSPDVCFTVFYVSLCDGDGALDYQDVQYHRLPGWGYWPPEPPDTMDCIHLWGAQHEFGPCLPLPYRVATLTYRAAVDHTMADLTLGEASAMFTSGFSTYWFVNKGEVIARIRIGAPTSTETTSWGSVKSLFR